MSGIGSLRVIGLALVALALAACARDGDSTSASETPQQSRNQPVTAPDTRVDAVATAEPGTDRTRWKAQTELARGVTGNLTASLETGRGGPLILAFANGITMRLERIADQIGADRTGSGGVTFSSTLGADPNAGVIIYRVAGEQVASIAPRGGLCQGSRTAHVAISEFVNRRGEWVFTVAAYRGASPPGPQAQSDPMLCAGYGYAVD